MKTLKGYEVIEVIILLETICGIHRVCMCTLKHESSFKVCVDIHFCRNVNFPVYWQIWYTPLVSLNDVNERKPAYCWDCRAHD